MIGLPTVVGYGSNCRKTANCHSRTSAGRFDLSIIMIHTVL